MIRRCALIGVAIRMHRRGRPARVGVDEGPDPPIPITSDPVEFDGFCPFPIEYQDLRGAIFQLLTFDADGNLTGGSDIHSPGLTSEVSANGKSVVFNDAGTVTVIRSPMDPTS